MCTRNRETNRRALLSAREKIYLSTRIPSGSRSAHKGGTKLKLTVSTHVATSAVNVEHLRNGPMRHLYSVH